MKYHFFYLALCFFLFIGFSGFSQEEDGKIILTQKCLIVYNDINSKGIEVDITAIGWFSELPYVPNYTYNDPDAGRRVTIRTQTTFYKGEKLYSGTSFILIPGDYGIIKAKCRDDGEEFIVLNLNEIQEEFVGLPLTVEVLPNEDGSVLIFESYPFEEDFPFKFEEDVVITRIPVPDIESRCTSTE